MVRSACINFCGFEACVFKCGAVFQTKIMCIAGKFGRIFFDAKHRTKLIISFFSIQESTANFGRNSVFTVHLLWPNLRASPGACGGSGLWRIFRGDLIFNK